MPPRAPAPAPQLTGYRFERVLGSGGFADVYLYEKDFPQMQVAVKALLSGADADAATRLRAEADTMARLRHPNVVKVQDAGIAADGRPVIVMEYCPGLTLAARVRQGPLPVPEVLRIGIELCGALETAHRLGIVHRDVKPANVIMDDFDNPRLTDFGIAGARDVELGDGALSIPWAPPEAFRGDRPPNERGDVYSLGATLWHLLAGRSPFDVRDDNTPLAMRLRIESGALPVLGRADVPVTLERALQKAMATREADRFASALLLARALQGVQAELGVEVVQPKLPAGTAQSWGPPEPDPRASGAVASPKPLPPNASHPGSPFAPPSSAPQQQFAPPSSAPQQQFAPPTSAPQFAPPTSAPQPQFAPPTQPVMDGGAATVARIEAGRSTWVKDPIASVPVVDTVSRPQQPAPEPPAPQRPPLSRRGRWALLVLTVVVVVGVSLGVALQGRPPAADSSGAQDSSASASPQDVLALAPAPSPTGTARRTSATSARFTWSVSEPGAVAYYVVRRSDTGSGPHPKQEQVSGLSYDLTGFGAEDRPCLEVQAVGADGAASAPGRICVPQ